MRPHLAADQRRSTPLANQGAIGVHRRSSAAHNHTTTSASERRSPVRKRLVVALAAALVLVSCSKKEEDKETEAVAPVQVAAVEQTTIHRVIDADAVLWAVNQATIMPKIAAPVAKFLANRGDHVKTGQLLAVLEARDLRAAVTAAKGQLDQAAANLRTVSGATVPESAVKAQTDVAAAQQQLDAANKLVESRRNLYQQGALARRLVDEAEVQQAAARAALDTAREHLRVQQSIGNQEQVRAAEAQVEAARGQYQSAEAQVAYSEIHSPIDGVIADRPLFPGDLASTGQPLFVIMDISRIVARANVPQVQAAAIHLGAPATIRLSDGANELPGKVTVVSPATDPSSTTVQVWVEAPNPGERLKPGAAVRVAIDVGAVKDALTVPASAIVAGEEGGSAVVSVANNVAHPKKVELGVREGDRVQIVSGVSAGEQVVTVGAVGLEDKTKVRIVKPEAEK